MNTIETKIKKWPGAQRAKNLIVLLNNYLINELEYGNVKPKRVNQIAVVYSNCYELQLELTPILKRLEVSYLLGENEFLIKPMIEEYCLMIEISKILSEKLLKLKGFQEISKYSEEIIKELKPKAFYDMLYKDLEFLKDNFNVDMDIGQLMKEAKSY